MTDFRQAASHAKNLAKQFRGVMEIADALDTIGNLEQIWKEAEHKAMQAREEFSQESFKLARAKSELVKAEDYIEIARDEVAATVQETENRLKKLIEEAEVDAAHIVAKAHEEAKNIRTNIQKDIEIHRIHTERFVKEEVVAQKQVDKIKTELAELRKRIE